jgi:uncharacterized protein (DUF4415 family)
MSALNTKRLSKTNWEQVDKLTDSEIDTTEIPPLTKRFFERAKKRPADKLIAITVHLDPLVLEWFKAQGNDYEKRINAALRLYAETHQAYE